MQSTHDQDMLTSGETINVYRDTHNLPQDNRNLRFFQRFLSYQNLEPKPILPSTSNNKQQIVLLHAHLPSSQGSILFTSPPLYIPQTRVDPNI